MPFTFSHPAIILPFLKNKKMSATALVVGSMSPDFEYFFRMKMQSELSHTFLGLFLIDFPLCFLVIFVFHGIIKKPLIDNLPLFLKSRLQLLRNFNWFDYLKKNVFLVLISFLIGALSHLFWDSMTHWDGYLVQRITFFNEEVMTIPIYKIAQHLSTVVGLAILFFYIHNLAVDVTILKSSLFKYWFMTIAFAAVILIARFMFGLQIEEIGSVIVSILFSGMLALTVVGLIFRFKKIT